MIAAAPKTKEYIGMDAYGDDQTRDYEVLWEGTGDIRVGDLSGQERPLFVVRYPHGPEDDGDGSEALAVWMQETRQWIQMVETPDFSCRDVEPDDGHPELSEERFQAALTGVQS